MESIYQLTRKKAWAPIALLTTLLFTLYVKQQPFISREIVGSEKQELGPKKLSKTTQSTLSTGTTDQIQQNVAKREYHISFDPATGLHQSPNRKQNLRAFYKPGNLTIQNRVDSIGHDFKFQLVNEGIFADGHKLYSPQSNAALKSFDNKIQIDHQGFTEEFVNNEDGIRQNFIVKSAPKRTSNLQVKLSVENLIVKTTGQNELELSTLNQDGAKASVLKYNGLKCWDANGSPLSASLDFIDDQIVVSVNSKDATYPVTIDPIISNGTPGDANTFLEINQETAFFGWSVASAGDVNGDGYSDIIVGAPNYDNGKLETGAAFIYHGSANGTQLTPNLLSCNQSYAEMGNSVSSAGDINADGFSDIIIGAYTFAHGQNGEGLVFIYYGSLEGISENSVDTLEIDQPDAHLGSSVASAGDVNNDGFSDVIIGAELYTPGGAALIFHGSANGIMHTAVTILKDNQPSSRIGVAVAGAGDVNGDGFSDVLIGANDYKNDLGNYGAVFISYGSASGIQNTWTKVIEGDNDVPDLGGMGANISTAGDVNGDGYSDVIIGDGNYYDASGNQGVVYIFHGSEKGLSPTPSKRLDSGSPADLFGRHVACAGDVNGDGYSDIMVSAIGYSNGEIGEGAVFVYHGSPFGVNSVKASTIEGNTKNANFGTAVSSAGDVNGDGYSDILIGTWNANSEFALVFHGSASTVSKISAVEWSGQQSNAQLGFSVAGAGDVNGDGFSDVIVGAPKYDNGQTDEGIAILYYGSLSGVNFNNSKLLEVGQSGALMGCSVAGAGDVNGDGFSDIIVGAKNYNNGQVSAGAAFVYHGSSSGVISQAVSFLEWNQTNTRLGTVVSAAGDLNSDGYGDILVSAPGFVNPNKKSAVFAYYGSATGIANTIAATLLTNKPGGIIGRSLASAGDINGDGYSDILVSIEYQENQETKGTAAVYCGSSNGINNSPTILLETDKLICQSVAGAGDLNGDGYSDIVVGVPNYYGLNSEGGMFVFHGSASGVENIPNAKIRSFKPNSFAGTVVSSAGDLNGDGYSDIILGVPHGQVSLTNEGFAIIYHGSQTGISGLGDTRFVGGQTNAENCSSIAFAGDINGDGYSDVIVGAPLYNSGTNNEGLVSISYGNNGGGLRNNLRLYNSDNLNTVLNHSNISKTDFGLGLFGKSFLGRNKGKIVWETRKEGEGFSQSSPITNSTQFTDQQPYFSGTLWEGTEFKALAVKVGQATKVRARIKYDAVLAITGQVYGPWRYLPSYMSGNTSSQSNALPVTLVSFSAQVLENNVKLDWLTATEINSKSFEIQRSRDGKKWNVIGSVAAAMNSNTKSQYHFTDSTATSGTNLYRLKMIDTDQTFSYSSLQSVTLQTSSSNQTVFVYPNPASEKIYIQSVDWSQVEGLQLNNLNGKSIYQTSSPTKEIDVKHLNPGLYILIITNINGSKNAHKVAIKR